MCSFARKITFGGEWVGQFGRVACMCCMKVLCVRRISPASARWFPTQSAQALIASFKQADLLVSLAQLLTEYRMYTKLMGLSASLQTFVCLSGCRWQSFYRGGSVAFYVTMYAVGFLGSSLHNLNGFLSVLTYLGYMSIMILGLFTAMGTVGFVSSFVFVYEIFAAVKQD